MVYVRPLWFEIPSLLDGIEVNGEVLLTKKGETLVIRYPDGVVEYHPSSHKIQTDDISIHINLFHWLSDGCHPATFFAALTNAAYAVIKEGLDDVGIVETCFLDEYGVETPYYYDEKKVENVEFPDKVIARVYRKRA